MNKDEGKILGIIGGMGPLATNVFYQMIIDLTPASKDQDHINMIILNHATMPDRTEAIQSGDLTILKEKLLEDATYLQASGAACIAIPCNTSHVVMDEIQKELSIPIVNMVRETADHLITDCRCLHEKVGIMATDGTISAGIFQRELEKKGMIPVIPTSLDQNILMHIIYDGVKAGGKVNPEDVYQVVNGLQNAGCKQIVLACTELSCLTKNFFISDVFVDAMEILARKVITICKG